MLTVAMGARGNSDRCHRIALALMTARCDHVDMGHGHNADESDPEADAIELGLYLLPYDSLPPDPVDPWLAFVCYDPLQPRDGQLAEVAGAVAGVRRADLSGIKTAEEVGATSVCPVCDSALPAPAAPASPSLTPSSSGAPLRPMLPSIRPTVVYFPMLCYSAVRRH
jgi:hypothetical protein